ncbi:alpha/beta-hydrolase [Cadophora sp. DSE1049]|nr:alpha/beta-hydrolase [Cadophora sp. DSE1049]
MPLQSDVIVNYKKFDPSSISPETSTFNIKLQNIMAGIPKWYEIGAAKYRSLRRDGRSALPAPVLLPEATNIEIPSRDHDRTIRCRLLRPRLSNAQGVFMHLHGGGWVLNDEESSDLYLQKLADGCGLLCLSVGYRLAPENPFPAATHDCYDAAEWLVDNAQAEFGTPLKFVGGESAGANLAVLTVLHLLNSPIMRYSSFHFQGLLGHYGTYSLLWLASTKHFKKDPPLVLDEDIMTSFRDAYLPGLTMDEVTSPEISPFFANFTEVNLPPAFFTCGTEDCLLDDSVFMSVKWMMAGGEAIIRIYPGSPHGYIMFSEDAHENASTALGDVQSFVSTKMAHESKCTL